MYVSYLYSSSPERSFTDHPILTRRLSEGSADTYLYFVLGWCGACRSSRGGLSRINPSGVDWRPSLVVSLEFRLHHLQLDL